MRSPGSAGKGAKDKGCPVTCQAGIGVISLGGQHHAPTPLPPWRRRGTCCTGGLVGLEVGPGWSGKYRPPPGFEPRCFYADYPILVTRKLRLPEFLDNQHMKVVRLSAVRTGAFTFQEISMVLISARGRVDFRAIMQPEGVSQWKNPMIPSGTEPATYQLITQCLNQLSHRVPQ